jgi:UPF0755 protein
LTAIVIALALVALAALGVLGLGPSDDQGQGPVRVVVPSGASAAQIGELLDEHGVVSSAFLFQVRTRLSGRSDALKPGAYTLRRSMGYDAALDALAAGTRPDLVNVTLPEGRSRRELAPLVEQSGLSGGYVRATRRSPALDPRDYGAEDARDLEGFLFPASYEVKRGASVKPLVRQQLDAFKRAFKGIDLSEARRSRLTPYEVLTIASMVEREAQVTRERPLIASVIYNRLRQGEPLGIDATVRYASGNWSRPLTQSQLATDSPYNTRENQGLPPGPIGNPGLESIRAAASPARSDYLFYVVKPGTCGEHEFAATLAEFEQDSRRYDAERAARGGRSPTDCVP